MFCFLKYDYPSKSTEQLLIEFYTEMEDNWLDILCSLVFQTNAKKLLAYAQSLGYKSIEELLNDYGSVLERFLNSHWHKDEIEELDKSSKPPHGYRHDSQYLTPY